MPNKRHEDTNCNDVVKIELSVNDKKYYIASKVCNTERDLQQFIVAVAKQLQGQHLATMSIFGRVAATKE